MLLTQLLCPLTLGPAGDMGGHHDPLLCEQLWYFGGVGRGQLITLAAFVHYSQTVDIVCSPFGALQTDWHCMYALANATSVIK